MQVMVRIDLIDVWKLLIRPKFLQQMRIKQTLEKMLLFQSMMWPLLRVLQHPQTKRMMLLKVYKGNTGGGRALQRQFFFNLEVNIARV